VSSVNNVILQIL